MCWFWRKKKKKIEECNFAFCTMQVFIVICVATHYDVEIFSRQNTQINMLILRERDKNPYVLQSTS